MLRSIKRFALCLLVAAPALVAGSAPRRDAPLVTVPAAAPLDEPAALARAATIPRSRRVVSSPAATDVLTPADVPAPTPLATPAPVVLPTVADARAYALSQIGATQFACLDPLWRHESGWNPHATNRATGAYGIPQALPGAKMGAFGADWADDPLTQVRWGLAYIAARYGTACRALSYWQAHRAY